MKRYTIDPNKFLSKLESRLLGERLSSLHINSTLTYLNTTILIEISFGLKMDFILFM